MKMAVGEARTFSMTKKTKSPHKKAKDKAWDSFSRYIRTRDCIRFTGEPDEGMCITCKNPFPYKKLQAGHFIGGRSNAVLFDERIVYSQCYYCNAKPPRGLGGNYVEYFVFMEQEWGREKIDEFRALKQQTVQYKQFDYERIRSEYDQKYEDLRASV